MCAIMCFGPVERRVGPPDLQQMEAGNFYYCAVKYPLCLGEPGMQ